MQHEEYFKIIVNREIDFPSSPIGSHPYNCENDCRYCGELESWDDGYNAEIESIVEELEEEFDAEVEHLTNATKTPKKYILREIDCTIADYIKSCKISERENITFISHYGRAIGGAPVSHADSVIKALKDIRFEVVKGFEDE